MNYSIKNEFYTLTVSDFGAEMISLKSPTGYEYIWQNPTGEFWKDHSPLIFPVCGRLTNETYTYKGKSYNMKIHGFAMKSVFELVEKTDTKLVFSLEESEESLKKYPFKFKFVATYELVGEKLIFSVDVTNTNDEIMPYMFGWHPGFNLPTDRGQKINDYKVVFDGLDELEWFSCVIPFEGGAPSKKRALDNHAYNIVAEEIYGQDTMIFQNHNNQCSLYAEGYPYFLDMKWTENIPTLCIWKQDDDRAKFICIEPWASQPKEDATAENFDIRPMPRLEAGKTDHYSYTVVIREK